MIPEQWEWFRDRWRFIVELPSYNDYYVAGTIRPYNNGQFHWEVYKNRNMSIQETSGVTNTKEEAQKKVESYYKETRTG